MAPWLRMYSSAARSNSKVLTPGFASRPIQGQRASTTRPAACIFWMSAAFLMVIMPASPAGRRSPYHCIHGLAAVYGLKQALFRVILDQGLGLLVIGQDPVPYGFRLIIVRMYRVAPHFSQVGLLYRDT